MLVLKLHTSTILPSVCVVPECSDYRKNWAAVAQLMLLFALALFYLMGWFIGKASVIVPPYLTYPLTLLSTFLITRFR